MSTILSPLNFCRTDIVVNIIHAETARIEIETCPDVRVNPNHLEKRPSYFIIVHPVNGVFAGERVLQIAAENHLAFRSDLHLRELALLEQLNTPEAAIPNLPN